MAKERGGADCRTRAIIETEERRAREILARRRKDLEAISIRLLETETIDRDELETIARPTRAAPDAPRAPEPLGDPGHMRATNGNGRGTA